MRRNILIVIAVILALVLIGELVYILVRQNSDQPLPPAESTNGGSQQTNGEPAPSQSVTGGEKEEQTPETGNASTTETTAPVESADPTENTAPVDTTAPEDTTPEETTKETGSSTRDEDDLPPMPI